MAEKMKMNLRLFGDGGGAGAGAAPAGDGGTGNAGEGAAVITPGVLEDGTQVDDRLAARMEKQARRRAERGEAPAQAAQQAAQAQPEQEPQEAQEPSLDDQWAEAKKGKFREMYARDVQAAIQDRFKNQQNANDRLARLEPAIQALMKKAGVETEEDLADIILDDDSLYEEEAEEAGMTTEAYKQFRQLQDEHDRREAEDQRRAEDEMMRAHFRNLAEQGEKLKEIFPDFDLRREMESETFRRLTAPNSGLSVEAAYYAVHHNELAPQAMAYGMQRAQQQISQTIQANRMRPVEGAMKSGQPADVTVDPRNMSRAERQRLIERARRGEKIIL